MQPKELHDFLFKLYDYADFLIDEIKKGNDKDINVYLASLAYIEDMMDIYGRSLIVQSALSAGLDDRASIAAAHERIDLLRGRMNELRATYDFEGALEQATVRLHRNWGHWQ